MIQKEKKFVICFVKTAISEFVTKNTVIEMPKKYPKALNKNHGVFVTLHENGELRGCIGICSGARRMIENLRDAAIGVCDDPRFPPLAPGELSDIELEVSVLTSPEPIDAKDSKELLEKINAGKDGLIIECNGNSGLFLPQVWKDVPQKEEFLCHLCLKAGLPRDTWKNGARIYKFRAEIIEGNSH